MPVILIVDDEDAIRDALQRILTAAGYEVMEATNGREALALYAKQPPDLMILDMLMPEQDGMETLLALPKAGDPKAKDPKAKDEVKIIAMTGGGRHHMYDLLRPALMLGAHRSLLKPFTRQEVLSTVEELLAQP